MRWAQAGRRHPGRPHNRRADARLGQFLFTITRPAWLRLAVGLVFAAPAALAGYHAVHGIVKHAVPSETWQMLFSAIGAVAVGVTAWVRIAAAAPAQSGERLAGA